MTRRLVVPLVGAVLAVAICVAAGALLDLGPTDDAFITYRHARNFAAGHGLVFNPGEPVEATSNFLFALVLGFFARAGVGPIAGSLFVNLAALGVIVFLVIDDARRRYSGGPWRWTAGALVLVACPSMVYYVWVGLETVFQAALVLGACLALTRRGDGWRRLALAGVLFGLAAGTRLEALVLLPAALVAVAVGARPREIVTRGAILLGGLAAVFVPILAYRWWFYGLPLPNTYFVKVHGGGLSLLGRGVEYVGWFAVLYPGLVLVLVAAATGLLRRRRWGSRSGFLLLVILTQTAYTAAVGGDFFPLFRFFVPVLPIFALMVDDLLNLGWDGSPGTSRPALPFPAALLFALVTGALTLAQPMHYLIIASQQASAVKRTAVGKLLGRHAPRDATLLLGAAGAIPFFSGLRSHDVFGLTDPVVAHKVVPLGRGIPGHEKVDAEAQVARLRPGLILFNSWLNGGASPGSSFHRQVRFYRKLERLMRVNETAVEYLPMRLSNLEVTALVAVDANLAYRLGGAFQQIGAVRLRRLTAAGGLGESLPGSSAVLPSRPRLRPPDQHRLDDRYFEISGLPSWRRYPPVGALSRARVSLECHVSGLPELARGCAHLVPPVSIIVDSSGAGEGEKSLAQDVHLNVKGWLGTNMSGAPEESE